MGDGNFHFVACTFDGTARKLWVDGNKIAEDAFNEPLDFSHDEDCFIGLNFPGGPDAFRGVIDEIYVYNRVLSDAEIRRSMIPSAVVGSGEGEKLVNRLGQSFPNPFNPATTISFETAAGTSVRLGVYDLAGRLVRLLVDERINSGGFQQVMWDGRDGAGRRVASGTYFYRLDTGNYSETKRLALIK